MLQQKTLDLKSPVFYRNWSQTIDRIWRAHLTDAEYSIVRMIFDRTVGWGREMQTITLPEFEDGVYWEGKCFHNGTRLGRMTIHRAVKRLRATGCILTSEIKRKGITFISYGINFEFAPMLRHPKNPRKHQYQNDTGSVSKRYSPSTRMILPKSSRGRDQVKTREVPSGKPESVSEAIASGIAKNKLSKASRPTKQQRQLDLQRVWWKTWGEMFPTSVLVKWKEREAGALMGYAKRFRDAGRNDFAEYLEWCIRHWRLVVDTHFKWMLNKPQFPAILFLVRHSPIFESMYSHRKEGEMDMTKTTEERMIAELMRKGYEQSTAEREVSERLGLFKQRQTIKEESQRAQRKMLWLDSQKGWFFDRVRVLTKQVIVANPTATPEKLEQLAEVEVEKLWDEMEKGFGAYEENRSANE